MEKYNRQALVDAYAAAFKQGLRINRNEPYGVTFRNGEWVVTDPDLHVLDTVLLGHENPTGNWFEDVASALDSTPDFIRGFVEGLRFHISPNDKPSC